MKRIVRGLCACFGATLFMVFSIYVGDRDYIGSLAPLILAAASILPLFLWKSDKKMAKERLAKLEGKDFSVSKSVSFLGGNFYLDDANKKFAIITKGDPQIFDYEKLGKYELNEDGNSVISGTGAATVVGGLAFGLLGAMAGSAGKRKNEGTCTYLLVRVMINDLQTPQVVMYFIKREVKKSKSKYRKQFENAKNLAALLSYIEGQTAPKTSIATKE